jgi:hypothetical protein
MRSFEADVFDQPVGARRSDGQRGVAIDQRNQRMIGSTTTVIAIIWPSSTPRLNPAKA